ncbi:MAG: diguanylate cyclase, partial [Pseudomonadota bacterium]|nr:diguanylate cyclase [Pseudomonadota bacterium]
MKLSSQTNLGIVTLLFLAFTALSVAELRELQSNTSEAVTLQAEKSALVYKKAVAQQVPLSPQAERLALETLLESAVAQPYVSAASVVDSNGKEALSAKA